MLVVHWHTSKANQLAYFELEPHPEQSQLPEEQVQSLVVEQEQGILTNCVCMC